MYLINDPKVIKSVTESNKQTHNIIDSNIIDEQTKEDPEKELQIMYIDKFIVEDAMEYTTGYYIINQSNLNTEVLDYIELYNDIPKTGSYHNVVNKFIYKNKLKQLVVINVDTNYGTFIEHRDILQIAQHNNIPYRNEGIGTLLYNIIDANDKRIEDTRGDLLPTAIDGLNNHIGVSPIEEEEKEEQEDEFTIKQTTLTKICSSFNEIVVENVIKTNLFKNYQFVEQVDKTEYKNNYRADMKRCRKNILYHSKYEYPVYSVMDLPRKFDGIIKCGLFFIETNNIYPFRGDGWYCEELVLYGLEQNLIKLDDIKYEFIPSSKLPADYFKKPIDLLIKAFEPIKELQKVAINALIGVFGKSNLQRCHTKFTTSELDASHWNTKNKDVFIQSHKTKSGKVIYAGTITEPVIAESSPYPIYSYVLQKEAMELHKLEQLIKSKGGKILDRNTDAIRYTATKEINVFNECWIEGDSSTVKYQPEDAKPLKIEKLKGMCRKNRLEPDAFTLKWNIQYDYDNTAEEKAIQIINSNQSIHIDGKAGTGKTYLTNKIIEQLNKQNKKYLSFSPTNKGARLIGGNTIDSLYTQFKGRKNKLFSILKDIEYLLIDEVGMMVEQFYRFFILIKQSLPLIKFILSGDYSQFAPVADWYVGDYKNSPATYNLCNGNRIQLTKCRRSNKELFDLYTHVETIDKTKFKATKHTYLNVSYTHKTRIEVNKQCMNKFILDNAEMNVYEIKKDEKNQKSQDVSLCIGMPVIAHKTNKKLSIMKSQRFIVSSITDDIIKIKDDDREIEIELKNFNKLFYIGFCITLHSSQGETFNEPYTIYDWNNFYFDNIARYVALSRATCIENIQIAER